MIRHSWFAFLVLVALARTSQADPFLQGKGLQHGMGIEIGAIAELGGTEYAANNVGLQPDLQGLVLRDRNGMTTRWVFGLEFDGVGAGLGLTVF